MMYTIIIEKDAAKFLQKLSGKIYNSVVAAIENLATNPRPDGCAEVKPYVNIYRIRQGAIRIIYEVNDTELIIKILDIGNRGQIYNDW